MAVAFLPLLRMHAAAQYALKHPTHCPSRSGEAETQLMSLVSHEEASAEACLAGLKAALAAPGGAQLARWGGGSGVGQGRAVAAVRGSGRVESSSSEQHVHRRLAY